MKLLVLSNDETIRNRLVHAKLAVELIFAIGTEAWTIAEALTIKSVSAVLIDDDFARPNSERIIKLTRQIKHNIPVIFLTSDKSIELGKRISQLGIDFYGHKPIGGDDLGEAVQAILKARVKQLN